MNCRVRLVVGFPIKVSDVTHEKHEPSCGHVVHGVGDFCPMCGVRRGLKSTLVLNDGKDTPVEWAELADIKVNIGGIPLVDRSGHDTDGKGPDDRYLCGLTLIDTRGWDAQALSSVAASEIQDVVALVEKSRALIRDAAPVSVHLVVYEFE